MCLWDKLTPAHDPFIGGMMHDIGKVALIQSYPGLFPLIVEELQRENWNVSMRSVEDLLAGGAHHNMVGQVLSESWKLGPMLTRLVADHHTPSADDPFSQLLALADFVGGYIYLYPKASEYPMTQMLRDEDLQADAEPPAGLVGAAEEDGQEGEEQKDEAKEPGAAASLAPGTAIYNFLPPDLLQRLDLDINMLISAARHIKPTVERLTEEIRKSV